MLSACAASSRVPVPVCLPYAATAHPENAVSTEVFRQRVEREAARHRRHLSGFGLVRIGLRAGSDGQAQLDETIATETRCTDSVCRMPDNSWAILAVGASIKDLRALATRLRDVVLELTPSGRTAPRLSAGLAAAGDRRLSADEVWMATTMALLAARARGLDFAERE